MPRRQTNVKEHLEEEPPRKKSFTSVPNCVDSKQGEIVTDLTGKKWKLGKAVGIGGFGEIYQASKDLTRDVKTDTPYVAKIEKHTNGPLFVEINCYLRIGKLKMIDEWKEDHNLKLLGMPHYVASGSHVHQGEKYRFLIMPRFEKDLEAIFQEKKVFNLKTVLGISMQIVDLLEYVHNHGYVHSDIKASNIMLGKQETSPIKKSINLRKMPHRTSVKQTRTCNRRLRPLGNFKYLDDIPYLDEVLDIYEGAINTKKHEQTNTYNGDKVYLIDYGLASKYLLTNGDHRDFCTDERRAHAGTVLFCSRDAHKGVPSRRSDLESLAYNMIYWLTGSLPWIEDLEQPEMVEKKKNLAFSDFEIYLDVCFADNCPSFMLELFKYLSKLSFEENPDYDLLRNLFRKAIKDFGYKDDSKLDFDNLEGWGSKPKKIKSKNRENRKKGGSAPPIPAIARVPLHSNIMFKRPKLRKKIKDKYAKDSMMNWSRILIRDPEMIIKQKSRSRKTTESSDPVNVLTLDLPSLNPTPQMTEVFNRSVEREGVSPRHRGDEVINVDNIEGYTPEMLRVYARMRERQEMEFNRALEEANNNKKTKNSSKTKPRKGRKQRKPSETHIKASSRTKSQTVVTQVKKEVVPLKKVKGIPLKRVYSLRG